MKAFFFGLHWVNRAHPMFILRQPISPMQPSRPGRGARYYQCHSNLSEFLWYSRYIEFQGIGATGGGTVVQSVMKTDNICIFSIWKFTKSQQELCSHSVLLLTHWPRGPQMWQKFYKCSFPTYLTNFDIWSPSHEIGDDGKGDWSAPGELSNPLSYTLLSKCTIKPLI